MRFFIFFLLSISFFSLDAMKRAFKSTIIDHACPSSVPRYSSWHRNDSLTVFDIQNASLIMSNLTFTQYSLLERVAFAARDQKVHRAEQMRRCEKEFWIVKDRPALLSILMTMYEGLPSPRLITVNQAEWDIWLEVKAQLSESDAQRLSLYITKDSSPTALGK